MLTGPELRTRKDFKVAVVGGGMGGLALAVGLIQGGVIVDIFEQAPNFEEIGAGVWIGANGIRALQGLGILDSVLERAEEPLTHRSFLFLSGLAGHEEIFDYPDAQPALPIHRAQFLDILAKKIPSEIAHFNKKCTSVAQLPSGQVSVAFDDDTMHIADLVVGCDGIRSAVRKAVVGQTANVTFTGTVAYRGLIPYEDAVSALGERVAQRPLVLMGPEKHLVVFPIMGKELTNIVAFSTDRISCVEEQAPPPGQPWVVPSTQEEMLAQFEGWGPKTLNILQKIKKTNKWLLHASNPPLNTYIEGRVVLLGDAAHSMLPHLGAGAGQALEDALLLSQLLTHSYMDTSNLELILQAYDHVRRPRANGVLTSSSVTGEIYEHHGPSGASLEGLRKDLDGMWHAIWHHDLDEDFREAARILQDKGVCVSVV